MMPKKPAKDKLTEQIIFKVKPAHYKEFKKRGKGNANKFARRAALKEIASSVDTRENVQ